ncbi:MAG TPA: ACT domain-containing protein [Armatimonadota bacterium]|jgi:glycine cleavage system transcriptional repressor
MPKYLLITASGQDRPGLVAGVTEALWKSGCNLEDSSMTRLRGEFAIILLARHPDEPVEPLRARLDAVGAGLNLTIGMRELEPDEASPKPDEGDTFHISVYGTDRSGIVHAITERLAARGADITDLRTTIAGAPDRPIYVMQIEALAAPDEVAEDFTRDLVETGRGMGVDVGVQRLDPVAM